MPEYAIRPDRRTFIGGSDARIVVGDDEAALLRLWLQKRGEVEPDDLSGDSSSSLAWPSRRPSGGSGAAWKAASPLAYSGSSHRNRVSRRSGLSI